VVARGKSGSFHCTLVGTWGLWCLGGGERDVACVEHVLYRDPDKPNDGGLKVL